MSALMTGLSGELLLYYRTMIKTLRTIPLVSNLSSIFYKKRSIPKGLPSLGAVEQVSSRVTRVLAMNPGPHTLHGTNTYLVGSGSDEPSAKMLIDTGENDTASDWLDLLLDDVFPQTKTTHLSSILLTHGHYDHQGGVLPLLKELERRGMVPLPMIYKRNVAHGDYPAEGFDSKHIEDGQEFKLVSSDGSNTTTIKAIYCPGHTDDSICMALIEDSALFSGDTVLGCGTAVFDDLSAYMQSLEKMRALMICNDAKTATPQMLRNIYPGHGPCSERGLEAIDSYMTNRLNREKQILAVLRGEGGQGKEEEDNEESIRLSSLQIVDQVYGELNFIIRLAAQGNVTLHLQKLLEEGVLRKEWPDTYSIKI